MNKAIFLAIIGLLTTLLVGPAVAGNITIVRSGASVDEFVDGDNHSLEDSIYADAHGILLGNGPGKATPVYRILLPPPTSGYNQITSIAVSIEGNDALLSRPYVHIGTPAQVSASIGSGVYVYSFSGNAARNLLDDVGDGLGYTLNVEIAVGEWTDQYDLKEIKVTYEYSGVSSDILERFEQAYTSYRTLKEYESGMVNSLWNTLGWSSGYFYQAVQESLSLADNLSGLSGSLFGSLKNTIDCIENFQNLGENLKSAIDYRLFWFYYGGSSKSTVSSKLNDARDSFQIYAQNLLGYAFDGDLSSSDAANLNSNIDTAKTKTTDLKQTMRDVAQESWNVYWSHDDNDGGTTAQIMLYSLAPLLNITYNETSLESEPSYLTGLIVKLTHFTTVTFHKISASFGSHGLIDPEGDVYVEHGGSMTFNAIPDSGYEVDRWNKNDFVVQNGGSSYTVSNVQSPTTVSVTFKPQSGSVPAPAWVSASDGEYTDKIALSWQEVSVAYGYDVYRSTTNDSLSASWVFYSTPPGNDDRNIDPGKIYYYWVKAKKNVDGNIMVSPFSPVDSGYAYAVDTLPPNTAIDGGSFFDDGFTINYSGTDNVTSISNLVYSYKLEGHDSDWSAFTSSTSKRYVIPNGSYTFYVRAMDEAGNIDLSPASQPMSQMANFFILNSASGQYLVNPSYSPDGIKISYGRFSSAEGSSICVMNADGSGVPKIIVDDVIPADWPNAEWLLSPSWSADGSKIAYSRGEGPRESETFDIWTVNSDGTGIPYQITTNGKAMMPSWSPDGKKIAYSNRNIWIVNSDGTGIPQKIADNGFWPTWSPDCHKIAYISFNYQTRIYDLWVTNSDGIGEPLRIKSDFFKSPIDDYIFLLKIAWSPDGKKIAYISNNDTNGLPQVWVTNSDGSGSAPVINNYRSTNPAWSPDFSKIVYTEWGSGYQDTEICIMDYFTRPDAFPAVNVIFPNLNQQISGIVDIIGTAKDNVSFLGNTILSSLSYWTLEYGEGERPETWTNIVTSSTPKFNELLASWNTSSLASGKYALRLRATDGVNENVQSVIIRIRTSYILGKVTLNGGTDSVSSVQLTLGGDTNQTTYPNTNGNYSFIGLEEGNYTVTPSLTDYHFFPASRSYSPLTIDESNQDFTGLHNAPDSDADNIPDWWEQQIINYDSNDGINTVEDVNPGDDFDGDGWTNIIEYKRGTNPTDPYPHPSMAMPWIPLLLLDD